VQLISRTKPWLALHWLQSVKAVECARLRKGFDCCMQVSRPCLRYGCRRGDHWMHFRSQTLFPNLFGQKIKTKSVATSVSGHSVIVKKNSLADNERGRLSESIQWEAEQHIPLTFLMSTWLISVLNQASSSTHGCAVGRREEGRY